MKNDVQQPPAGRSDPTILTKRFVRFQFLDKHGPVETFRAWDQRLERHVLFKIYRQDVIRRAARMKRLVREVKQLAGVTNPHVARILDFGRQEQLAYVAVEPGEGIPLLQAVRHFRLQAIEIVTLLMQAADGLAAAADVDVLHRNINPNVLLVTNEGFAKICDFGLGLFVGTTRLHGVTRSGYLMGTEGYVAPELINGERTSEASEVFSLGVVLYEALTGHMPYQEEDLVTYAFDPSDHTLAATRPSRLVPELDSKIDAIVLSAIALAPTERCPTLAELRDRLAQWLEDKPAGRSLGSLVDDYVTREASSVDETVSTQPVATAATPSDGEPAAAEAEPETESATEPAAGPEAGSAAEPQAISVRSQPDRLELSETYMTALSLCLVVVGLFLALHARPVPAEQPVDIHVATRQVAVQPLEPHVATSLEPMIWRRPRHLSAMATAVWSRRPDLVLQLIQGGAAVNERDEFGRPLVMIAARLGSVKIVTALIGAGAQVDLADELGRRALHCAAAAGYEAVVEKLLLAGSAPDSPTKAGATVLHYAAESNSLAIVKALLRRGSNVNATDNVGMTPLHRAACVGALEVANCLLNNNAAPATSDQHGWTAAQYAEHHGHSAVAKLIERRLQ